MPSNRSSTASGRSTWRASASTSLPNITRPSRPICQCRTEAYGSVCYQCEDCGHPHVLPAACGNRHCPQCQHRKTQQWLERGLQRQLPGHHFMLTFTVPEPLRAFLRSHQELGYDALFAASSQAIKALVHDPRCLGADRAGFFVKGNPNFPICGS